MKEKQPESYEPARPKILNHLIKAALFGATAWCIVFVVVHLVADAHQSPAFYAFSLLAYPFLAGFCRNLQALFARPHLRLTHEGIHLRYWKPVDFPSFRMFWPTYGMVECLIPWQDYQGCRTYTHTINSIPNWQALIFPTASAQHTLGWDIFRPNVFKIQAAILDYWEIEFRQPARQEADVPAFCRERFQAPVRIAATSGGGFFPLVAFLLMLISTGLIWSLVPTFPETAWIWIPILLGFATWFSAQQWLKMRGKRVLELRSEGLALGDKAEGMRVIPWEDILFVRPRSMEMTHTFYGVAGKPTPAYTTGLEVRLRDRSSLTLEGHYQRPLDDLHELIDPPLAKLHAARDRIAQGEDIETAATAAGLPKRDV